MRCSHRNCENTIVANKKVKPITGLTVTRQKLNFCSKECRNAEAVAEYVGLHRQGTLHRSSSYPVSSRAFGNLLLNEGTITPYQMDKALELKSMNGRRPLAYYMLKKGWVSRRDVLTTLAKLHKVPYIVLGNRPQASLLSSQFSRSFLKLAGVMPFSYNRPVNRLCVAMKDPSDLSAIRVLKTISGSDIQVFQGDPVEIDRYQHAQANTPVFAGAMAPNTATANQPSL